jgi:hypothetical protein
MNVAKLRKLERFILAEPRRFDMKEWGETSIGGGDKYILRDQKPPCGFVGCLAGSAVAMEYKGKTLAFDGAYVRVVEMIPATGEIIDSHEIGKTPEMAQEILGLSQEEADRLFFLPASLHEASTLGWPEKYDKAYQAAKTLKGKARVAVRRIEHFIKTKGKE